MPTAGAFTTARSPGRRAATRPAAISPNNGARALAIDPAFVFVTNWNEWIAGRFSPANMPLHGTGPVTFVDEFDAEFSRDIEPMKGGHGDNYYYQMIANIRRFKGARPIPPVEPRPITIDGRFEDWAAVQPEYRDTIGDPVHRDHRGWGKSLHYVNATGRNDIVAAKVSIDEQDRLVLCANPRQTDEPRRAELDAPVHRRRPATRRPAGWATTWWSTGTVGDSSRTIIERNIGGRYAWGSPVEVPVRVAGNEMELAIPARSSAVAALPAAIDFKWADNIQQTGDWSDFTVNGDAAPNDRYNYRAILQTAAP